MPVPVALRSFVYRRTLKGPIRTSAEWFYHRAIGQSSRRLYSQGMLKAVYLRGGLMTGCCPGISDIDLTLFLTSLPSRKDLQQLRRQYFRLRRRYWALGETLVFSPQIQSLVEQSSLPSAFFFREQRKIHGDPETPDRLCLSLHLEAGDRLALAFVLHEQARKCFGSRAYPSYFEAQLSKQISKLESVLAIPTLNGKDWAEKMANALIAMTKFSRALPPSPPGPGPELLFTRKGWLHEPERITFHGIPLEQWRQPRLLWVLADTPDPETLSGLFRSLPLAGDAVPLVLTPELFCCYKEGLGMRFLPEHLNFLRSGFFSVAELPALFDSAMARVSLLGVESLLVGLGAVVSESPEKTHRRLSYLGYLALTAGCGLLCDNPGLLARIAEPSFPAISHFVSTLLGIESPKKQLGENFWNAFPGFYTECFELLRQRTLYRQRPLPAPHQPLSPLTSIGTNDLMTCRSSPPLGAGV